MKKQPALLTHYVTEVKNRGDSCIYLHTASLGPLCIGLPLTLNLALNQSSHLGTHTAGIPLSKFFFFKVQKHSRSQAQTKAAALYHIKVCHNHILVCFLEMDGINIYTAFIQFTVPLSSLLSVGLSLIPCCLLGFCSILARKGTDLH